MNNIEFWEPLITAMVAAFIPTGLILWRLKKLEEGQLEMARKMAEQETRMHTFWIEKWPNVGILEVRVASVENVVRDISGKLDHMGPRAWRTKDELEDHPR